MSGFPASVPRALYFFRRAQCRQNNFRFHKRLASRMTDIWEKTLRNEDLAQSGWASPTFDRKIWSLLTFEYVPLQCEGPNAVAKNIHCCLNPRPPSRHLGHAAGAVLVYSQTMTSFRKRCCVLHVNVAWFGDYRQLLHADFHIYGIISVSYTHLRAHET